MLKSSGFSIHAAVSAPCTTIEELIAFNNRLSHEEEFMLVFYAFKTLREDDLGKTVRRVLCNIANNATLELFSRTDKNTEKTPLPLHV